MKIMKYILLFIMTMFLSSSFTNGLLGGGESFYEDFTSPSNNLNTSNWAWTEQNTGASYSVSGGIATFTGGAINHRGSIVLKNLDYNVNAKDNDFSIEMRVRGSNFLDFLVKHFYIGDNVNFGDNNVQHSSYFYSRLYGGGSSSDTLTTFEKLNSSHSLESQSSSPYTQLSTTYAVMKWIKTDNNIEYLYNGVSQHNETLLYIWNDENNNIADNLTYFSIQSAQHNNVVFMIDYINITNLDEDFTEVNINVTSPENQTTSNTKEDVEFTVTGDSSNYNCSLYLNDVLEDTNATVLDSVQATFYLDVDTGDNDFYINCTDNTTVSVSGVYDYWYDPNDPFINLATPNPFNTTIFDSYSIDILGNITNEELEFINITIFDQNDDLYYTNVTTSFGDPTTHLFDWSFVTNGSDNGVWDMYIYGNDTSSNENELHLSFTVDNCIPNWACGDYGVCNESDLSVCNDSTDLNSCGLSYTGDLSEFSDQVCDYCSPTLILHTNATECVDDWQLRLREDNTFETCCNVTGFASDCGDDLPNPEKLYWVNTTCSIFEYDTEDISEAVIDGFVVALITIGSMGAIIVLLMLTSTTIFKRLVGKK